MHYFNNILLLLLSLVVNADSANILFHFGIAGHSHVSTLWPLIEEMGERGHNITLLTSFLPKFKSSKVNVIHLEGIYNILKDEWDEGSDLVGDRMTGDHINVWYKMNELSIKTCLAALEDPGLHAVLYDSEFDLAIIDNTYNDCALALAYYQYKCPYISYSAHSSLPHYYDDYGIPLDSSHVPDMQAGFKSPMSFFEKVMSTLQPLRWWLHGKYTYYPQLGKVLKNKLNLSETPEFSTVKAKTSLVLSNTHFSKDYTKALPPLFVYIAGLHIPEITNSLSDDLENFVSTPGKKGFIYVSFGTAVRISKSHDEVREKFFRTIGNFSQWQFVWKWEEDIPTKDSYPSNIHFAHWLPQIDLFAHSRIRGFIGHGGSNGINEAVHFGVPMLIFPIFADQDYNANSLAAKDLAIVMEISKFSQQELTTNLEKVLFDKEFHKRVAEAKFLFRDRPMKPLETAVWWVEYVLRHPTNHDLITAAVSLSLYQRLLLDVWSFLLLAAIVAIVGLFGVLWTCWTIESNRRKRISKHISVSISKAKLS